MTETIQITGRERSYTIHIHTGGVNDIVVVYLTMPRKMEELSTLYQRTREQSGNQAYTMLSVEITDWNGELSPWEFREENGKMSFAGRGEQLLADLEQSIIPGVCQQFGIEQEQSRFAIVGYSLAGLFSVWTMYQTKLFQGAASCSGSLWYPGFLQYAFEHELGRECALYFSLGDKEEKVRNPHMAKVGKATEALSEHYLDEDKVEHMVFEWNVGNHFQQVDERLVKGMAWVLRQCRR